MYQIILKAHSGFRYLVLSLLLLALSWAFLGVFGKKEFSEGQRKVTLFALIFSHVQLLVGLILHFLSPNVDFSNIKVREIRYWSIEHLAMMLLALALITIGYSKSKRATDSLTKHKKIVLFFGLGLLVIVVAILQSGRGLL